jgi:type IV pilus assembly protein PilX
MATIFIKTQQIQKLTVLQNPPCLAKYQNGVVLVIGLIMLLLMTLIGTTGMQGTLLEEKMAGNMRDRNLAFQSAESALKDGETFLASQTPAQLAALDFSVCLNGLYPQPGTGCSNLQPVWDNINWDNNNDAVVYGGAMAKVKNPPKYIIENMGSRDANGDGDVVDGGIDQRVYRVTSRAVGGTADAVVMLQSIYEIPI